MRLSAIVEVADRGKLTRDLPKRLSVSLGCLSVQLLKAEQGRGAADVRFLLLLGLAKF